MRRLVLLFCFALGAVPSVGSWPGSHHVYRISEVTDQWHIPWQRLAPDERVGKDARIASAPTRMPLFPP